VLAAAVPFGQHGWLGGIGALGCSGKGNAPRTVWVVRREGRDAHGLECELVRYRLPVWLEQASEESCAAAGAAIRIAVRM